MNCLEFTNDYDTDDDEDEQKYNNILRDHLRYFLNSPLYSADDTCSGDSRHVEILANLVIGLNFRQYQILFSTNEKLI